MENKLPPAYEKLFAKFNEIDTVPPKQWGFTQIIGYFCKKYEQHYNVKYTFDFKKSPSKSVEAYQINRLVLMLSSDGEIIKNYIDWIFSTQVQQKKRRITSIGFLATPAIVADFKLTFLSAKIDRGTQLSPKYLEICEKNNCAEINNYGNLSILRNMIQDNTADEKYKKLYNILIENGFQPSSLDGLK